jgi:uncharacterized protein involved in exopolysaccharide biosynthesis
METWDEEQSDNRAGTVPVGAPVRRAYAATFRKHRLLFCIAPVLAALVAGVYVFSKGSTYQASASLWIDNPPPLGSSLNATGSTAAVTPSTQVQTLLTELLATREFVFQVADGSQLLPYLRANSPGALDDAIMASVGPETSSSAPGPQVLTIDYKGPTAAVAQSVLQRLIVGLQSSAYKYGDVYVSSTLNYYKSQANSASATVKATQNEIARYLREHPGASVTADPAYAALNAAAQAASAQLTQAETSRVQASGALRVGANSPIVKVVDKPTLPSATSTSKKKIVETVFAGFVAGAFISLLAIVLMTPGIPEPPEPEAPERVASDRAVRLPERAPTNSARSSTTPRVLPAQRR